MVASAVCLWLPQSTTVLPYLCVISTPEPDVLVRMSITCVKKLSSTHCRNLLDCECLTILPLQQIPELLFHLKTLFLETRTTCIFPGCHFKIKFVSLTVTGRQLKILLGDYRNPLGCPLSCDSLGTRHNFLTFGVGSAQWTISQYLQHQEESHWGFGDNPAWIHGPASLAFKDF